MKVLVHCPASHGGIAEHAHYQAAAMVEMRESDAVEATLLCGPDFLAGRRGNYPKAEVFGVRRPDTPPAVGRMERIVSLLAKCWQVVADQWYLAREVWRRKPTAVLLSSYVEYLAPLWVWPHLLLAKYRGVTYVANLHDPVRDYVVGPKWWHDLSVRLAYWPISVGVVHEKLPEPSPVPPHVRIVEAPVGVYDLQESPEDLANVRSSWGVPDDAVVFLAFGYIRDNKNLDLVICALVSCPRAYFVIMGKAQSQKDKPVDFYRKLAEEVGVSDRVRFYDAFVPDEKLASYFAAADVIVLTYDKTFCSQSGVLNIAARARRPVLASAGESPLKTCVEKFRLGVFVAPDDLGALEEGMKRVAGEGWRVASNDRRSEFGGQRSEVGGQRSEGGGSSVQKLGPDWEGYEAFASWRTNAEVIVGAIRDVRADRVA